MADETKHDKPFLSRWSERKRAVQAGEAAREGAPETSKPAAAEELRTELDANRREAEAIDLETLTDTSDYAPFLRPGVPALLKQAALRKLWRSNPVFAGFDGLFDHDLNYRWSGDQSEVVKTAWKVGQGLLGKDEATGKGASVAESAAECSEPAREAKAELPEERAPEPLSESADEGGAGAAQGPDEERPGVREPAKVSLSRRVDLAAFTKERGGT